MYVTLVKFYTQLTSVLVMECIFGLQMYSDQKAFLGNALLVLTRTQKAFEVILMNE